MTELMSMKEELKVMNVPDKDVRMFELIQKYKDTPYITLVLQVISEETDCTKELWEEIADICFSILSDYSGEGEQKQQALSLLQSYRWFIKSNTVNMDVGQIPDDILKFERAGRRVYSKLHGPLNGVDLEVNKLQRKQELEILKKDAMLLTAMIEKKLEKINKPNQKVKFLHKIYRDSSTRKQMIQLDVVKYQQINQGPVVFENREVVFSEKLPFKKSDKKCIEEVNKSIKQINREFKLKVKHF
ncbi:hypothetical protein [Virgibacillus halodenitrificans]|uniref:hypothetical protein n=1 Tax=Virgibacillus halodenitrificans TaxID=1482 RepID=UPI000EF4F783|nr:hypothetical protein [Virgibacillus halodenitrificans]